MKQEKSCGAVIFREDGHNRRFYLILTSTKGHVTLCKGHVEKKETEHETAIREIMEETGLTVEFVDGFREVITYSPRPGHMKDVVFFLARGLDGGITCQPEEVADARFLPFDTAMERLTHSSDRETLEKAEAFLNGR
ncbi:MAG: NUDIX domain-containing protein [Oscillospiraceae bacterium]|nr:NUDIX domain-containing protein [Oscillospiraceae bacterium]